MKFNFKNIFEQLLKEVDVKEIGIFPGKFKPPHKGHFHTCAQAAKENKLVLVLISNKEHEGITAQMSLNIWNIYKKYISNIIPFIVSPTPVLGSYDIANILNNGEYKSAKGENIKSNVLEIFSSSIELESFLNVGNNFEINLYASPEDMSRFKNINKEPYKGKNVMSISMKPIKRLTSASKMRDTLKNSKDIATFLPDILNEKDKKHIINILNVNV